MSNKDEIKALNLAAAWLRRRRSDLERTARRRRRDDPTYEPPSVATRKYFAVSTTNPQGGWTIYNDGIGKYQTELDFLDSHRSDDIYEQTLRVNLRIVPESGLRKYGLSADEFYEQL